MLCIVPFSQPAKELIIAFLVSLCVSLFYYAAKLAVRDIVRFSRAAIARNKFRVGDLYLTKLKEDKYFGCDPCIIKEVKHNGVFVSFGSKFLYFFEFEKYDFKQYE